MKGSGLVVHGAAGAPQGWLDQPANRGESIGLPIAVVFFAAAAIGSYFIPRSWSWKLSAGLGSAAGALLIAKMALMIARYCYQPLIVQPVRGGRLEGQPRAQPLPLPQPSQDQAAQPDDPPEQWALSRELWLDRRIDVHVAAGAMGNLSLNNGHNRPATEPALVARMKALVDRLASGEEDNLIRRVVAESVQVPGDLKPLPMEYPSYLIAACIAHAASQPMSDAEFNRYVANCMQLAGANPDLGIHRVLPMLMDNGVRLARSHAAIKLAKSAAMSDDYASRLGLKRGEKMTTVAAYDLIVGLTRMCHRGPDEIVRKMRAILEYFPRENHHTLLTMVGGSISLDHSRTQDRPLPHEYMGYLVAANIGYAISAKIENFPTFLRSQMLCLGSREQCLTLGRHLKDQLSGPEALQVCNEVERLHRVWSIHIRKGLLEETARYGDTQENRDLVKALFAKSYYSSAWEMLQAVLGTPLAAAAKEGYEASPYLTVPWATLCRQVDAQRTLAAQSKKSE